MKIKKVCLNCKGNWEECQGFHCQCWDGVCCNDFKPEDMKQKAFWYEEVKEDV